MSAEVETMFSVRETPWHGLGTIVQEAPTSLEALKLAGLDWDVVQEPAYRKNGVIVDDTFLNVRTSDDKVLGKVGNRYKIVQNRDAFDFTDNLIGGDVRYETAGSLRDGKCTWLLVKLPDSEILGDAINNYVCFSNTHDGTGAVKCIVTPVRVVCQNTLNYAISSANRSWSMRHTSNIQYKMDEARNVLKLAELYNENLKKTAEKLALERMSNADVDNFLNLLYPVNTDMTARKIENIDLYKSQIKNCLAAPDLANICDTKYGMLNAISDFVTHTQPVRVTDSYRENNFSKILSGHDVMDRAYSILTA